MFAENEYLFRHAVLRDAAYQLQPPAERGVLHREVLDLLPDALSSRALDAASAELALHARCACDAPGADVTALGHAELTWLQRASDHAREAFRLTEAAGLLERIAAHPLTTPAGRARALVNAAGVGIRAWPANVLAAKLEFALEVARRENLPDVEALALSYLATLHDLAGRMQDAEAAFRRAIELNRQSGDAGGGRNVQSQLATLLRDTGRNEEAEELFVQLIAQGGADPAQAIAMTNFAGLLSDTGRADQAEQLYGRALEIFRAHNRRQFEGSVLANIANLMLNEGRLQEAEPLYARALDIHRESGNRRSLGICLGNLARLCHDVGERKAEAERLYSEALQIHREMGNRRSEATVTGNYGALLLQMGELGRAGKLLESALQMHRASRNVRMEGVVLGTISSLELLRGREAQAREAQRQAQERLSQVADTRMSDALKSSWRIECEKQGLQP